MRMGRESPTGLLAASLIEPLTIPAVFLEPDGTIIHHNPPWVDWISIDPTPMFGPNIQGLIHPDQRDLFLEKLTPNGLQNGDGCVFQTTHKGRSIWFTAIGGADKWSTGILGLVVPSRNYDMQSTEITPETHFWSEVMTNLPDGFWSYDRQSKQHMRSDAWFALRGHSRLTEPLTEQRRVQTHPKDTAKVVRATRDLLRYGSNDVQYRQKHANGTWVMIRSQGRVTEWDQAGRPLRVIGSDSDATHAQETEASLAELNVLKPRWQYAMDSDLHGLWDFDLTAKTRFFSPGWRHIRGLNTSEEGVMPNGDLLARVHPHDRPALLKQIEAINTGKITNFCNEFREKHSDGHWVWILSRGQVISHGPDGRPTRVIGTDTDITYLKELGGQFDDISKRLELAVRTSGIGVWEHTIGDPAPIWDAQMYKIYGLTDLNQKLPASVWEDALHPDDKDDVLAAMKIAISQGSDFDITYRIIRTDGEIRHLRATGNHYIDPDGTAKVLGINWDKTREYEQAAALRHAKSETEKQNIALAAAHAEMEHLSNHDALTDLPNRRMLASYRKQVRQRRIDGQLRSAVLHIDLDRFKQINDKFGHAAGDAVLCHVADILRRASTPNSIIARVGGDEFVIFIDHAPHDALLGYWARSLVQEARRPFMFEGNQCRFGFSIGIAVDDGTTHDDTALFENADLALYRAKEEGRGQLRFYSPDLKTAAITRRQCADDILAGIDQGQFQCVYQPQYACKTLEIIGAEALVRWDHPTRGRLAPDAFMEVAEDLDIVAKIDQAVFEIALEDSRKWRSAGRYIPQISVNVSAKRLLDPMLPMRIAHLANEEQRFAFELLESVFLDDAEETLQINLEAMRGFGVAIEVDDFGTGHASMLGLLNLRPSRLKIDRQLIIPLLDNKQQRQLVASIIEIGHVLGIAVVAEGVETQDHIDILSALECDYLQGYGLARPMDAQALEPLLPKL